MERLSSEMKKDQEQTDKVKEQQIADVLSLDKEKMFEVKPKKTLDKEKMFEVKPKKKVSLLTRLKIVLGNGNER